MNIQEENSDIEFAFILYKVKLDEELIDLFVPCNKKVSSDFSLFSGVIKP